MFSLQNSVILDNWAPILFFGSMLLFLVKHFNKPRALNQQKQSQKPSAGDRLSNAESEYPDSVQEYPDADPDLSPALKVEKYINYPGARKTLPGGGVDKFYEIVNDRRSVRQFSSRSVDISTVEKCIHSAGTSPSGAHCEPWTFCLVTNPEIKQQIREIVEQEEYFNYMQRMHRQWTADLQPFRTNHVKEYLTTAPCLILVFKQTFGQREDGKRREHYYNEISTSIATGILLCALQSAGLSSLVTTPLNCGPALRGVLNRPVNEKLLVLLPVGYPAEDCQVPDLGRKSLEEIMVKYE